MVLNKPQIFPNTDWPFDDALSGGEVVEESGPGADLRVDRVHSVPVDKVYTRRDHLHAEEPVNFIFIKKDIRILNI